MKDEAPQVYTYGILKDGGAKSVEAEEQSFLPLQTGSSAKVDKYWAKEKYSQIDPFDYEKQRFKTRAGELIDFTEKKAILDLLGKYAFHHLPSKSPFGTSNVLVMFDCGGHLEGAKKLKILDVATGSGRLAFFLEKNLKQTEITGVDINENMLERAQELAQENNSQVKFVKGDIYNLPFKDNQFDAIVGLRFSMHLPQIDKVIKEFLRVLKSGGILIFDIFNYQSILRLKLLNSHNNKEECGFYTIGEITRITKSYKFKLQGYKGILFFGETLLRKFPDKLLFLLSPIINPPKLIEKFSSKLVLSFKKYDPSTHSGS